ncbi:MAG: glycosyltransferase [Planctomycetota bacterium]
MRYDGRDITVLLPVHNAAGYLAEAIESILGQTADGFRLLICDDGSTDETPEIIRAVAMRSRCIDTITQPNRGLVETLNRMIGLTQTPIVARMDADDVALPERFALQLELFNEKPEAVCIGGGIQLIDSEGLTIGTPEPTVDHHALYDAALRGRTPLSHPTFMMKTEALRRVGGYDHGAYPAEDLDLLLRLGEIGELGCVEQTVLRYRVHEASVSVTRRRQQIAKMREACRRASSRTGVSRPFWADERGSVYPVHQGVNDPPIINTNPTAAALAWTGESQGGRS